jgi:hypothetical protein
MKDWLVQSKDNMSVIVIMTNETYPWSFVIWGHIIFTLNQPVFHLLLNAACKAEKQLIQNLTLWFELTKNLTLIYHTWYDVTNHYTTRWLVSKDWLVQSKDNMSPNHKWSGICFVCHNHNHLLLSFMAFHLVCMYSNTMGATSGAGIT